jgi:energy-coupling factor transporter ATP-binding protein EcfA2
MRVEGVVIEPFRRLWQRAQLQLEAVNLMFGPNGSGKSSALDAIASVYDSTPNATLFVRLEEVDRRTIDAVYSQAGAAQYLRRYVEEGWSADLSPEEMLELLGEAQAIAGDPSAPSLPPSDETNRGAALADALLADVPPSHLPLAQRFVWGLIVDPLVSVSGKRIRLAARKQDAVRLAAPALAVAPDLVGTWVHAAATQLTSGDEEFCSLLDLGPAPADVFPPVARLDGGSTDLGREVEDCLPALHDAYWGSAEAGLAALRWDRTGGTPVDPWLERLDDEVGPRSTIRPVLDRLAELANGLLPRFVRDEGAAVARLRPHEQWAVLGHVEVVCQYDAEDECWSYDDLAAGARTWFAVAIREAMRLMLGQLPREVFDYATGTIWEDGDEICGAIEAAARRATHFSTLRVTDFYPAQPSILLADEPELHLHPLAVLDVGEAIRRIAESNQTVIVATHAHQLLDMETELLGTWRVVDGAIDAIGDDVIDGLWQVGSDIGLRPSDLLGLTRAVLLVEGVHDVMVLRSMFGHELDAARIVTIPLFGTRNALAAVDAHLLPRLGLPVYLMFDHVTTDALTGRDPANVTSEVKSMRTVVGLLRDTGVAATAIPYEDPDIIAALPEKAVQRAFDGVKPFKWSDLIRAWSSSPARSNFKVFAMAQLGVAGTVRNATAFVQSVLDARLPDEAAGPALGRAVETLLAQVRSGRHAPEPRPPSL